MIIKERKWKTIKRPGYSGKHKNELHRLYNKIYGKNNWRTAWIVNKIIFSREEIILLYEDSYYIFLKKHQRILQQLLSEAKNVYDDAVSNISSGLDYCKQETNRTHYQDISIRRCVLRFGLKFKGNKLIQIRDYKGEHPLSLKLSPGRIPFHMKELIKKPELTGWWKPGSIESFYQSNKILQVKKE
jgi:hypothetical protein